MRGQLAAEEIIRQHREVNSGNFPETTAVTLWGLDAIKTRGEYEAQIDIVYVIIPSDPSFIILY